MRLLFAGTPVAALPSLAAVLGSRHQVAAVLTRPDAPAGRGRHPAPSPVKARALAAGLEVLTPARPGDPELVERLTALDLDAAAVVAYGALLPASILDLPRNGWVNLHFSVLPAWRGAAPVQHALIAGDEVTGATTFRIAAGMDTGPVYGTLTEAVRPRDTAGDLLDRLAHAGAGLLVRTLDALADGVAAAVPQPAEGVSLAPRLTPDDARVRWDHPALAVDRRVRGCTPEPGAWTTLPDGTRLGLGPVLPDPDAPALPAGQLRATAHAVHVGTATVPVRLGEVVPASRRPMPAADWARGARLAEGTVLGGGRTA